MFFPDTDLTSNLDKDILLLFVLPLPAPVRWCHRFHFLIVEGNQFSSFVPLSNQPMRRLRSVHLIVQRPKFLSQIPNFPLKHLLARTLEIDLFLFQWLKLESAQPIASGLPSCEILLLLRTHLRRMILPCTSSKNRAFHLLRSIVHATQFAIPALEAPASGRILL